MPTRDPGGAAAGEPEVIRDAAEEARRRQQAERAAGLRLALAVQHHPKDRSFEIRRRRREVGEEAGAKVPQAADRFRVFERRLVRFVVG